MQNGIWIVYYAIAILQIRENFGKTIQGLIFL